MRMTNTLLIAHIIVLSLLAGAIAYLFDVNGIFAPDEQSHIIEQPEKQTIYLVNESAVFEREGYYYFELDGDLKW
jgi:hypothetical protein